MDHRRAAVKNDPSQLCDGPSRPPRDCPRRRLVEGRKKKKTSARSLPHTGEARSQVPRPCVYRSGQQGQQIKDLAWPSHH